VKLVSGVDMIEIERLREAVNLHGERFLNRIFTARELAENVHKVESLAGRFAAKEAASKAFGSGIGDVAWKEIEILRGDSGQPLLVLHGAAKVKADELKIASWSVSISHTGTHAIAFVVGLAAE
jgi:holo-[acyl-carrier protein] synthase